MASAEMPSSAVLMRSSVRSKGGHVEASLWCDSNTHDCYDMLSRTVCGPLSSPCRLAGIVDQNIDCPVTLQTEQQQNHSIVMCLRGDFGTVTEFQQNEEQGLSSMQE